MKRNWIIGLFVIFSLLPAIAHKKNPRATFLENESKCLKNDSVSCNANYEYLSVVEGNQKDALSFAIKSCDLNDPIGCLGAALIYSKHMADTRSALMYFEKGLKSGYKNWEYLENESTLSALKKEPQYSEILNKYKNL